MKNARPLYIVCQVFKVLFIIIYKIQPLTSFISYLLFYIFLFNGFTQTRYPHPLKSSKLPKGDDAPLLARKRNLMLQKSDKS